MGVMPVEWASVAKKVSAARAGVGRASPTAAPSRVLLVDNDENTRILVKLMLEGTKKLKVVGEAEDTETGVALAAALRPDIVVLDIQMPGQRGVDVVPMIRKVAAEAKIVVFSDHVLELSWLERQSLAADLLLPKGDDGYAIRAALLHLTSASDAPRAPTTRTIRDQEFKGRRGSKI